MKRLLLRAVVTVTTAALWVMNQCVSPQMGVAHWLEKVRAWAWTKLQNDNDGDGEGRDNGA